ncbi:hypothetical protein ACQ1PF_07935 [Ornithobacterium rhinotracheale]
MEKGKVKATSVEVEERIELTAKLLLRGKSYSEIVRLYAKKYDLAPRTVDNYIRRAKEKIKSIADIEKDYEMAKAFLQLDELYTKNMEIEDFRECRAIIESKSKLFGWAEAQKIDINIEQPLFGVAKLKD